MKKKNDIFDDLELDVFDEIDLEPEEKVIYSQEVKEFISNTVKKEISDIPVGKIINEILDPEIEKNKQNVKKISTSIVTTKNEINKNIDDIKKDLEEFKEKLKKEYANLRNTIYSSDHSRYEFGGYSPQFSGLPIGSLITNGTEGSVLFIGSGGVLAEDNANFFWDDTNNKLRIKNALDISETGYSTNGDFTQGNFSLTTNRNFTGTVSSSAIAGSFITKNQDNITITSGKVPTTKYYGISVSAYNNGRVISGTNTVNEGMYGISNVSITETGNSITNSSSVAVNRFGIYSVNYMTDTLNNASLTYTGAVTGGAFIVQANIVNTASASRTITVTGVYGDASTSAGEIPNNCYGGQFTASGGASNYGCYAIGDTAALLANGHILFEFNNTYTFGTASLRASNIYSVLGNFSGNVSLASGSVLDWNSDVTLYRNAADELRTPDSIRVDSSIVVGTTLNTDIGILVSKTYSTDTTHYGVQGSCTFTGGNSSSTNVFSGLYGSTYLNAGANTFNNAYGVFGTTIIAPGQSGTVSNAYGLNFGVSNQSTSAAPITNLTGARVAVVSAGASVTGTVTNVFGFDVASSNNSTSAQIITNFFGLRINYAVPAGNTTTFRGIYVQHPTQNTCTTARGIEIGTSGGATCASTTYEYLKINNPSSGGAITTQYGIRIQDLSYASTNYGIYFDGTSGLARQGIWWNADTNLYRSAAGTLKTDHGLITTTFLQIPGGAGGTTVDATGEVTIDSTSRTFNFYDGTIEAVVNPVQSKSITIENPTSAEDISIFYTDDAITITKLVFVITGSTSATTTIRHHTDRNNAGNEVVTGGTTANSTTTGNVVTSFNDATVPADSFIWLETTALSGTPTTLSVTIFYRQDA